MNDLDQMLVAGRDAYHHRDYSTARDRLGAARAASTTRGRDLSGADLAALHDAAWWHGSVAESIATGADAYRALVADHEVRLAAWVAIGIAVNHLLREEEEPGLAWLDRAAELLAGQDECPEQGFLRYLTEVEARLDDPDPEPVVVVAREIRELGQRLREATLVACGDMGEGRALLRLGRVPDGLRLIDRAMLAVAAGELHPEWAGDLYRHMMSACDELGDLRRARRWTAATERWLATMPTAVLFAGVCRIHRAKLHRMAGDWPRAAHDAAQVGRDLAGISRATVAEAHYLVGEIHRLRGDHSAAEKSYRDAHRIGRDPQPGLALLRLAQGRATIAAAEIRIALTGEPNSPMQRASLRAAQVEIALAAEDPDTARQACEKLTGIATTFGRPLLRATARQAVGALRLAEGQAPEALTPLREACRLWHELDAPYETARVRLLLAQAHRALGDPETARWETDEATNALHALGAAKDLHALTHTHRVTNGLTPREDDVLRCLASGSTNRTIADQPVISEKTVARHLANIYTKLRVTSRTAAAAYAFEHDLGPHQPQHP